MQSSLFAENVYDFMMDVCVLTKNARYADTTRPYPASQLPHIWNHPGESQFWHLTRCPQG